jgi:hypothetical protein
MAAALEVADVFRRHGDAFRQAHAGHLGRVERRIMGAITACRTSCVQEHLTGGLRPDATENQTVRTQ